MVSESSQPVSAFTKGCVVEAKSRDILIPIWKADGFGVEPIEGKENQRRFGDVILSKGGKRHNVELKAERESSPNLFIEEWSNALVSPGWVVYCETDVLVYHFLDSPVYYRLAWCEFQQFMRRDFHKFPLKPQNAYEQKNDTWGRCVPIKAIEAALGTINFKAVPLAK